MLFKWIIDTAWCVCVGGGIGSCSAVTSASQPIQHCSVHWQLARWGWALPWQPVRSPCCREVGWWNGDPTAQRARGDGEQRAIDLNGPAASSRSAKPSRSLATVFGDIQGPGHPTLTAAAQQGNVDLKPFCTEFKCGKMASFFMAAIAGFKKWCTWGFKDTPEEFDCVVVGPLTDKSQNKGAAEWKTSIENNGFSEQCYSLPSKKGKIVLFGAIFTIYIGA